MKILDINIEFRVWKISLAIFLYIIDIKRLNVDIMALMEHDHYSYYFTVRHRK